MSRSYYRCSLSTCKDVKKVKDADDLQAIKTATEALSTELQKIGEIMQKAQAEAGAQAGTNPNPEANAGEEKVRDAEFKENPEGGEEKK